MDRRVFFGTLGLGLLVVPRVIEAQPTGKLPTVGFLDPTTALSARERTVVFVKRLQELGWVEGRTVAMEYRWADGRTERFGELAAELVRLKVDVIATWGTETAVAAKQATSTIPIVFTIVGDPVGSALVASLARPGGNITGLSTQHNDTAGKRLELLREVVPHLRRLAVMANIGNSGDMLEARAVQVAARTLGIKLSALEVRRAEEITPALQALRGQVDALYVVGDALFFANRDRISAWALDARLPTMHGTPSIVEAGGLMSYTPNYLSLFRRAADYVDKILRGLKPADLPVEQPTKFELVINLKTAKALGLTIPPSLLGRADEIIQ